jgi:exopolysaccharide biosynthesis polyprenyl glycosylphosphotransferase
MRVSRKAILFLLGDLAVLFGSILLAYHLRIPEQAKALGGLQGILRDRTGASTIFILATLLALYIFDNYEPRRSWKRIRSYWTILAAVASSSLAAAALFYISAVWKFGRGIMAMEASFSVVGICLVRWGVSLLARRAPMKRNVLVVGSPAAARAAASACSSGSTDYKVVCCLDAGGGSAPAQPIEGVAIRLLPASVPALVKEVDADAIVVALSNGHVSDSDLIRDLMGCKISGIPVREFAGFYKGLTGRVPIDHVDEHWFLVGGGFDVPSRPLLRNLLRLMDVGCAGLGLALSLPFWPLIALLVKFSSPGPVFYSQIRLGEGRKPFNLVKFRTMRQNAEKDGAVWSQGAQDPRVTLIGRCLRRTRLDELPQLWAILKGEMSFIGPRPERPEFVEGLEKQIPFYGLRFAVRPGLTGWAQVNYRYGASSEDAAVKLQYDLYYVQENSLLLNVLILLKTIQTVLLRTGS